MSKTARNADIFMSVHLKSFQVQYLNNKASDHPGFYPFFAHLLALSQAIVAVFEIALLQLI